MVGTAFAGLRRATRLRCVADRAPATTRAPADSYLLPLPQASAGQTDRQQPFYHVIREDGSRVYVAQSSIEIARIPANSTDEEAITLLRGYLPLLTLREVERCFATISVAPWRRESDGDERTEEGEEGEDSGVGESEGGQIRMVMNPWMRQAWPFD